MADSHKKKVPHKRSNTGNASVTGKSNSPGPPSGSTNVGAKTNNAAADNSTLVKSPKTNVTAKGKTGGSKRTQ